MSVVRFFFGHGWWTALYLVMHGWLLVTVVFMLLTFGQDLKPAGQPPDLQSPGSIFVLLICVGLCVATACFAGVGIGLRYGPGWGVAAAIVLGAIVLVVDGYFNLQLAEQQNGFWFGINVAVAVAVILANLAIMHGAINRPAAPPPLPAAVLGV